jgi:hypothetical protein
VFQIAKLARRNSGSASALGGCDMHNRGLGLVQRPQDMWAGLTNGVVCWRLKGSLKFCWKRVWVAGKPAGTAHLTQVRLGRPAFLHKWISRPRRCRKSPLKQKRDKNAAWSR